MKNFVHLRTHSNLSFDRGLPHVDEYVNAAKEMGMTHMALTDRMSMAGAVRLCSYSQPKKTKHDDGTVSDGPSLGQIIGCDVLVHSPALEKINGDGLYRMLLLAKDKKGYVNLNKLVSDGHVKHGELVPESSFTKESVEGLICLTGALNSSLHFLLNGASPLAVKKEVSRLKSLFGQDLYFEVQRGVFDGDVELSQKVVQLAEKESVSLVATNPCYFVRRDQHESHELRVCGQDKDLFFTDVHRKNLTTDQAYLKSQDEMATLFHDIPHALSNTAIVASKCTLSLLGNEVQLPQFPTPDGSDEKIYFENLTREKIKIRLKELYPEQDFTTLPAEYEDRLKEEISVIKDTGFSGYFLIVQDFIQWARDNDVEVGPGRGSGAGSLVAFALGITEPDPLKFDLLFERFLNKERIAMPDFDIDFHPTKRMKVINYIQEKYGETHVSQICAHATYGSKGVLREVGAKMATPTVDSGEKKTKGKDSENEAGQAEDTSSGGLTSRNKGIPLAEMLVKDGADVPCLDEQLERVPELKTILEADATSRDIWNLSKGLEGVVRNKGRHAAGVLIAKTDIAEIVPLFMSDDGIPLSQFEKNDVEKVGLVKFDFLGLKNLKLMEETIKNIKDHNSGFEWLNDRTIPYDDPTIYPLYKNGDTVAVFQCESASARNLSKKMMVDCFEDVITLMAMNRPGPLGSGMVDEFVRRKEEFLATGEMKDEWFSHPKIRPVLESTYGMIVYQEQVMLIAQKLAGYTLGEADFLRKAMGKKDAKEMARQRDIFLSRANQNGIDEKVSVNLFNLIEKFGEYGFNRSHSLAYAFISARTAWLKRNFPAEYMSSVLSNIDQKKAGIAFDDVRRTCKVYLKNGSTKPVTFINPSVNTSLVNFKGVRSDPALDCADQIIFGLKFVKNVGASAKPIVRERDENGPYTSFPDFVSRLFRAKVTQQDSEDDVLIDDETGEIIEVKKKAKNTTVLDKSTYESLVRAGALDCFGHSRADLLETWPAIVAYKKSYEKELKKFVKNGGDEKDFVLAEEIQVVTAPKAATPFDYVKWECDVLGFSLSGEMASMKNSELKKVGCIDFSQFEECLNSKVRIGGMVTKAFIAESKNGGKYGRVFLSNGDREYGFFMPKEEMEDWCKRLKPNQFFFFDGFLRASKSASYPEPTFNPDAMYSLDNTSDIEEAQKLQRKYATTASTIQCKAA